MSCRSSTTSESTTSSPVSTSHPKIVEAIDSDGNLVEYEYYYEYVYEDDTTQPLSPTPPPSSGGDYNYDYYESSKTGNDWLSDR